MLEEHIANAHANRSHVPALCELLLNRTVIIIGQWVDEEATKLRIQDFVLKGDSFIPLFSDQMQFWSQMGSTPYLNSGLEVPCRDLVERLNGDELLVLNPGTPTAVNLLKDDFEPFLRESDTAQSKDQTDGD